jgi:hypothetical protein
LKSHKNSRSIKKTKKNKKKNTFIYFEMRIIKFCSPHGFQTLRDWLKFLACTIKI